MSELKPEPGKEPGSLKTDYVKYTGVAFQMVAIIGVFAYAGFKIDEHYKHNPQWVTAIFGVAGVCISIYQVIRQLKS